MTSAARIALSAYEVAVAAAEKKAAHEEALRLDRERRQEA